MPRKVAPGESFDIKVIVKQGHRSATGTMVVKTRDINTGAEREIKLAIENTVSTSPIIVLNNKSGNSSIRLSVSHNRATVFSDKAGTVSASLYSPNGKVMREIVKNQYIREKTTCSVTIADGFLANGAYILICRVTNQEGTSVIQRLFLP